MEVIKSSPDKVKAFYAVAPITLGAVAFMTLGSGAGQGPIMGAVNGAMAAGSTALMIEYTLNNGMIPGTPTHDCDTKNVVIYGSTALGMLMGAGSGLLL